MAFENEKFRFYGERKRDEISLVSQGPGSFGSHERIARKKNLREKWMDIELAPTCAQNTTHSLDLCSMPIQCGMRKTKTNTRTFFISLRGLMCSIASAINNATEQRGCGGAALLQLVPNATFWIYRASDATQRPSKQTSKQAKRTRNETELNETRTFYVLWENRK